MAFSAMEPKYSLEEFFNKIGTTRTYAVTANVSF
jgi:hypothetical protein